MKTFDPAVPFYGLPLPQLSSVSFGKSAGNISRTMSDFAQKRSFDYDGYAYEFFLPEDLCLEDNQMPGFDDSFFGQTLILGENEGSSRLQAKFSEPNDGLLGDSYENSYQHQDYWHNDHENSYLPGFHSEPQRDAQIPVAYHGCPIPAVSGLKFYQPYDQTDSEGNYDRISQVLSTSVADLHKLPNDFNKDYVEGKCIGKGYHFEKILHEAKNSGSYFGRSKNSNLMEKDSAHIFETYDQPNSEGNYDRISQVLSTSVTNHHKLPNDFNKDSVEGKCIGKGYHFEDILQEVKNSGSYFGRSKNSNLMEKDAAHIFETYDQPDSEGNYDRISQVLATSVANLHKLPNDFNKDSVEGKCIGKGYHFEDILHEAKNSGSYFGRPKNSNLMEKDAAHKFETNVGHFSSGHNAPGIDNLIRSLLQTEIQKQPAQNTSKTAETEENYNNFPYCWSYGEQLKVELLQAISSLTAHIGRLETQVEHLTHQVQDMSNKLSDEKKLKAPILDHSGATKAAFEESKITSTADETPERKLFIETEASYQKLDVSASDWEIL